ncbi:MAG: hypothetical protein V3V01_20075, partial [Acidimicrobiales bacterium]
MDVFRVGGSQPGGRHVQCWADMLPTGVADAADESAPPVSEAGRHLIHPRVSADDRKRVLSSCGVFPDDGWLSQFSVMLTLS